MKEYFAKVNNITMCYDISGESNTEPILLIHGFGSKKESWIAQVGALSNKFKVIRMDNRGAGKSARLNQSQTLKLLASDIAGLMDHLGIKKTNICGWSLGGMIVQHFLLHFQERVKKAALLFTNYKGTGIDYFKKTQHESLELLLKDPERAFWEDARIGFYREFRKEMEKNPKKKFHGLWSVDDLIEINSVDPPTHEDIDNQAAAIQEHDTLDKLHQIKVPILLIAGSHDRLCPESSMREMHERLPNSTFKIIQKAGHSAPLSRAPEVNKLLIEFFSK
ncbi:MAG: alpha/beta fold hydrolase [Promethearchaeota archaeon]